MATFEDVQSHTDELVVEAGIIYASHRMQGDSEGEAFVKATRSLIRALTLATFKTLEHYAKQGKLDEIFWQGGE